MRDVLFTMADDDDNFKNVFFASYLKLEESIKDHKAATTEQQDDDSCNTSTDSNSSEIENVKCFFWQLFKIGEEVVRNKRPKT